MDNVRSNPGSSSPTKPNNEHAAAVSIPRWVKLFVTALFVLVLLFVILHLTGHGFTDHLRGSSPAHTPQSLWS